VQRAASFITTAALVLVTSTMLRAAVACPDCAAVRQARSDVWNDDFGFNLAVLVLPFLAVAGLCLGVERIGRKRGHRHDEAPRRPPKLRRTSDGIVDPVGAKELS
jgi:hypothetical protein